ncbi:MAG: hypothetical protein HY791_31890 [Deltaproteobacteria bacterium]|nr:hypothetical protein [Deltaproteobacteria bacterium]
MLGLVLILAVPLSLMVEVHAAEHIRRARVVWLFGLVKVAVRPETRGPDSPEHATRPETGSKSRSLRSGMALLRSRGFARGVIRYIARVMSAIRARDVSGRLRIGLGDPSATGRLWAFLGPLGAPVRRLRRPPGPNEDRRWATAAASGPLTASCWRTRQREKLEAAQAAWSSRR